MDASDRRKRASAEASTWWVRLQDADLPRPDREEYVKWLRESQVHVAEMLRVARVHDVLDHFPRWADVRTDGPNDEDDNVVSMPPYPDSDSPTEALRRPQGRLPGPTRRFWITTLTTGLIAAAVVGVFLAPVLRGQTIETDRGERREVALNDGSVVQVDPETRLRVKFDNHLRRIVLERGRALFQVAKAPGQPFLVESNGTTVRALGTAFGVEAQKQGIVVTVAEGKVAVFASEPSFGPASDSDEPAPTQSDAKPQPKAPVAPRARKSTPILLTAGDQVTMQSSGASEPVHQVDSARALAWAKGQLVFDNTTVANSIEQFNRYNRVQLHVADDRLAARTVSAIFNASHPESFVAFLQSDDSVRVVRTDQTNITLELAK